MIKEKQQFEEDDGRVICRMDVEGMHSRTGRASRRDVTPTGSAASDDPLTRTEARRFTTYALLAVLLIGAIFSVTWIVFTLFLTKVLFR